MLKNACLQVCKRLLVSTVITKNSVVQHGRRLLLQRALHASRPKLREPTHKSSTQTQKYVPFYILLQKMTK